MHRLGPVAPEGALLDHQGTEREHRARHHREREEGDRPHRRDEAHRRRDQEGRVAGDLDQRPEPLEEKEVRHPEPADHAIAGVPDHAPVAPHRLHQPAVPPVALAPEHAPRLGHLGPAHGVGDEGDPVGLTALSHDAVETHDQLDVLPDRGRVVSAGLDHELAPEQPERPRDDEQGAQSRPSDPTRQERPQVLDDLQVGEQARRGRHLAHLAVDDARAVGDAHHPSDGDHLGLGQERPDQPEQRVLVEHRVRVHRAKERIPGERQPRVDRVRFAPVGLVDDDQAGVHTRDQDARDRPPTGAGRAARAGAGRGRTARGARRASRRATRR